MAGSLVTSALVAGLPRPVGLIGYGVEGRETLRWLAAHGLREALLFDRAVGAGPPPELVAELPPLERVAWYGERDFMAHLPRCGTVVRSPGVRPDQPWLAAARAAGARITSATSLFLAACPGPVAGVTGTLGKGTASTLIAEALRASGMACRLGGNIGTNPLAFLDELDPGTAVVLELSSFQLMDLAPQPRPRVAVVLRTTSEHQDWHTDVHEYRAAKRGLLATPGEAQTVIYCADAEGTQEVVGERRHAEAGAADGWTYSLAGPVREGIGREGSRLVRFRHGRATPLDGLERLAMPGRFNLENAAAAYLAAEALGEALAEPGQPGFDAGRAIAAIAAFPGLPHRLERVGTLGAVTCYNDSYGTRPDATLGAVNSFDQPLALILGGSEKHADFAPLAEALCRHRSLRRVVLIGQTAERIAGEIGRAEAHLGQGPVRLRAGSLEEALGLALAALPAGGVLLFSPACASFDMFPNYKVRGETFRRLVQQREQWRKTAGE
ncbi:MAG: UDP-N-acetylmuramoyl-L-alanine--D-glutamate ligase [Candidatus Lambdaproteobacteria bacterium]|nr:UDP-N-acetylmuramoyl-L-alanine--D-glutamate ligase [Candidatus Lambdaproteobacteria bacterium]